MDGYEKLNEILSPLVNDNAFADIVPEQLDGGSQPIPYIVFSEVSGVPENVIDGFIGHEWTRMQVDVYHKTRVECRALANKVINTIAEHINPCEFGGRRRFTDQDTGLARQSLDFSFFTTTE